MANSTIFGAVALIVVVAMVTAVGPAALQDSAAPEDVLNESINVNYSNETAVEQDGIYYDEQVTIVVDGATLEQDVDYTWDADNGTVTWHDTQSTNENDNATIDYTYFQPTDTTFKLGEISVILLIGLAIVVVWIIGDIAISGRF